MFNYILLLWILVSENVECNGDESNSEQEQQTLPIFEKFEELSNKVTV